MRLLVTMGVVATACTVQTGGQTYDFTRLSSQQLSLTAQQYDFVFTFCTEAGCSGTPSSLCQTDPLISEAWSLGTWSEAVWSRGENNTLNGYMVGDNCFEINRQTNVSFQCADGEAKLLSVLETEPCHYSATIQVPRTVCAPAISCCAPATFSAKRLEVGGSVVVVQRDAATGNWFDSDFEGRSQSLLCSAAYNRCFTYTAATCVVSGYRSAPQDCYGGPDWNYQGENVLVGGPTKLTQWMSSDGNYVVTLPFSSSTCVPVSGSAIDSSFGVSANVDPKWWDVPPMCVLALSK